jgi:predicted acetyltransferase
MTVEIRSPSEDELRGVIVALYACFGGVPEEDDFERHGSTMPLDRILAAFDDGRPVAVAASFPFELTIPGGSVPAAGVTWVGVQPSHRRRGILRGLMRTQLDDVRERGEPLAILGASEAAIYGRFGYGIAAPQVSLDAQTDRFRLRGDPQPVGSMRLVSLDEALELLPPVYEHVHAAIPGTFARSRDWWTKYKLADPEHWRREAGAKFCAALELDGAIEGYVVYRQKERWEEGMPHGRVEVLDAVATSPAATRELWRFVFSIDLVERVAQESFDPASPLPLMVEDARRLHLSLSDGLWLRLVDVEAALRARSYAGGGSVVLDVRDDFCPANAGRWRVGAEAGRTEADPDLELAVEDLACAYLGAFGFRALALAERARELRPGAVERADELFATARPPYCPEEF